MDDEDYQKHLEIVQKWFRSQFENGDTLALLDCIQWCEDYGLTISVYILAVGGSVGGRSPVTAGHTAELAMVTKHRLEWRWSQTSSP